MGRHNLAPQNVHKHASQLLHAKRISAPPPWYQTIGTTPPPQRLVRPAMQRPQVPGKKKASHLFKPVHLKYTEDNLRWEYFNDHPWELARPRVILENDGRDLEKWDWSLPLDYSLNRPKSGALDASGRRADDAWTSINATQSSRPINGEAVVQRQSWLLNHTSLSSSAAYDQARKELYRYRHAQEVEQRVAREEALATGAFFGEGPLDIGQKLEDKQFEDWRVWAEKQTQALKQLQSAAYSGTEAEGSQQNQQEPALPELEEVNDAIPASREGQKALGGTAIHP